MGDQLTAYISASSVNDPGSQSADFNPADFLAVVPNSSKLTSVTRLCYTMVSIPRMFPTIYNYNNTLVWYKRQVIETPLPSPPNPANSWLRTVANDWTVTRTLVLPTGQLNITDILAAVNAVTGVSEVWSYDSTNRSIVIVETPPGGLIAFGPFIDGAHVPPAVSYANMTYLGGGGTEIFDTLGIQRVADLLTGQEDSIPFNPANSRTFDAIQGSNLNGKVVLPFYDRFAHDYKTWATQTYTTPRFNPPRISGPTQIHVALTDLGNSQMISTGSGLASDVVTSVNMGGVNFGEDVVKEVRDVQGEGNGYVAPRDIKNFRVRLLDTKNRPLSLPRNVPVTVHLQAIYKAR